MGPNRMEAGKSSTPQKSFPIRLSRRGLLKGAAVVATSTLLNIPMAEIAVAQTTSPDTTPATQPSPRPAEKPLINRASSPSWEINEELADNKDAHDTMQFAKDFLGDLGLAHMFNSVGVIPRKYIKSEGYGEDVDKDMAERGRDARTFASSEYDDRTVLQLAHDLAKDKKNATLAILHEVGHAIFPTSKKVTRLLEKDPQALNEVKKKYEEAKKHYYENMVGTDTPYNSYDQTVFDAQSQDIGKAFWSDFLANLEIQTEDDHISNDTLQKAMTNNKNPEFDAFTQEYFNSPYTSRGLTPALLGKFMLKRYAKSPELSLGLPETPTRAQKIHEFPRMLRVMWTEAWAEILKESFESRTVLEFARDFRPELLPAVIAAYEKTSGQDAFETADKINKKYLQAA